MTARAHAIRFGFSDVFMLRSWSRQVLRVGVPRLLLQVVALPRPVSCGLAWRVLAGKEGLTLVWGGAVAHRFAIKYRDVCEQHTLPRWLLGRCIVWGMGWVGWPPP